jgi:hypothetical protein
MKHHFQPYFYIFFKKKSSSKYFNFFTFYYIYLFLLTFKINFLLFGKVLNLSNISVALTIDVTCNHPLHFPKKTVTRKLSRKVPKWHIDIVRIESRTSDEVRSVTVVIVGG